MDRFVGRVAVVTGASSGIGANVAKDLVNAGMVVVGVARRKDRLEGLAASLRASGAKGRLEVVQADLSSVEEVGRVFQWVEDNLGGVSVVVNNAAILAHHPIQDLDLLQIQAIIATNVTAVMAGCKLAISSMKKHNIRDGHVINVNSVTGHMVLGHPTPVSAYTSTKHAITAMSKALRFDVQLIPGFKIRVTSLSPGTVLTDMVPEQHAKSMMAADCILDTKDVSNAVMYALSCPPSVEITELTIQPTGEKL
ncbi:farnesol dehydrogenase-like [Thrips palmi]|uniref:Farnesol dehydrogenase-like n=1 Tax=Thrips palmi TaxID=161013 RepID=A0A6P8XWJ1_THRPL|nr:farnesol dehydrogenase-like [Thrips palmi]